MSLRGGIGLPELPIEDGQEFRLGIMGGTFDPIHYGHLVTAEQARESLDLDAVLFMPAGSPAFKLDKPVTPAEDPATGEALLYYGCRCDYRYCDLA